MNIIIGFFVLLTTISYYYYYRKKSIKIMEKGKVDAVNLLKVQGIPVIESSNPTGYFKYFVDIKEPHEQGLADILKYGKIHATIAAGKTYITVADPKWLREIFIKKFQAFENRPVSFINNLFPEKVISFLDGEEWREVRRVASHAFTSSKMKTAVESIGETSDTLCDHISRLIKEGKPFNARREALSLVIEVSMSSLIGIKTKVCGDVNAAILKNAAALDFNIPRFPKIHDLCSRVYRNIFPERFYSPVEYFKDLAEKVYEEKQRRPIPKNPDDVIGIFMEEWKKHEGEKNHPFSNDQVARDHSYSLFTSFDTTTMTLATALYSFAYNPKIQEKARAEVLFMLKGNDTISYETAQNLTYLEQCINETLRIYPPGYITGRLCVEDVEIEGVSIQAGTTVLIPIYAIHHHPDFFNEPEKFKPERFAKSGSQENDPILFLPFGHGPRHCLGKRLAVLTLIVSLAKLLKRFKFYPVPQTPNPIKFGVGTLGVLRKNEIIIGVEELSMQ